jgi:uncharacterized protein YndB with AHSA1/START domain
MSEQSTSITYAGIGDEAVLIKTGRRWQEWFDLLDEAGGRNLNHQQIVSLLSHQYGIGTWWQQMVCVGYEQACGKREKNQTSDGYEVSVSKTIVARPEVLFNAWADEARRREWLPGADLSISSSTPHKTMHIRWGDGTSRVDVRLYPRDDGRTQVNVQHNRLQQQAQVEAMRAYWQAALVALESVVDPR